jgi:hypothetical protein
MLLCDIFPVELNQMFMRLLVVIEIIAEKQENLFLNVLSGLQSINTLLLLNHDLKTGSM